MEQTAGISRNSHESAQNLTPVPDQLCSHQGGVTEPHDDVIIWLPATDDSSSLVLDQQEGVNGTAEVTTIKAENNIKF